MDARLQGRACAQARRHAALSLKIIPCESFPQISASAATLPASAAGFVLPPYKNYFTANSMRYQKFSERAPVRALDVRWLFAALPRVRARLAELRAARFATLHNHRSTANSRTTREAAQAREAFTARRPRAYSRGFHQRIGG
jgi:hypothetical protein